MKQALQLKIGQSLTITPQLQQAIKLLQMSTLDLQQEITRALEENPLLERDDEIEQYVETCLLYTSPSPRDLSTSRMPSSA